MSSPNASALGVWEEGERVPSEQALVAESGTSRGPVRQALARLRAEGLVAIVRLRLLDGEPVMFERSMYVIEAGRHLLAADLDANSIYHVLRTHGIFPTRAHNVIDAVAATEIEAR